MQLQPRIEEQQGRFCVFAGDAHDDELVVVAFLEVLQGREALDAGAAPGAPKVQEDPFTPEVLETKRLVV